MRCALTALVLGAALSGSECFVAHPRGMMSVPSGMRFRVQPRSAVFGSHMQEKTSINGRMASAAILASYASLLTSLPVHAEALVVSKQDLHTSTS